MFRKAGSFEVGSQTGTATAGVIGAVYAGLRDSPPHTIPVAEWMPFSFHGGLCWCPKDPKL